jgi:hypothetical protein
MIIELIMMLRLLPDVLWHAHIHLCMSPVSGDVHVMPCVESLHRVPHCRRERQRQRLAQLQRVSVKTLPSSMCTFLLVKKPRSK